MSHFTVLVTGDDVAEALAPFYEELEVPNRIVRTKAQIIADSRADVQQYAESVYQSWLADPDGYAASHPHAPKQHLKYLRDEFPQKLMWTDEQHYVDAIQWLSADALDIEGNEWSTRNERAKWDWWAIGGRWPGILRLIDGETGAMGEKSWVFQDGYDTYPDVTGRADSALRRQVDVTATAEQGTYAILHEGEWHARGEMGWFGISHSETATETEWHKLWAEFVEGLAPETRLTVVDCHI